MMWLLFVDLFVFSFDFGFCGYWWLGFVLYIIVLCRFALHFTLSFVLTLFIRYSLVLVV